MPLVRRTVFEPAVVCVDSVAPVWPTVFEPEAICVDSMTPVCRTVLEPNAPCVESVALAVDSCLPETAPLSPLLDERLFKLDAGIVPLDSVPDSAPENRPELLMIECRVEEGLPETSDPRIVLWLTCVSDAEVVADIEGWSPLRPELEGTAAPVADDDGPAGPALADEEPSCWDAGLRPDSELLEPASICVGRSLRDALVVASPPGWLPLARDDGNEELPVTCDC